jgi:hypothetical protein
MIAPGAVVRVHNHGDVAWVVKRRALDGVRWHVTCKSLEASRHRELFSSRIAGEGDIVVVRPAPTYEPGSTVTYNGIEHAVAADNGDSVTLIAPDKRFACDGGDYLLVPGGNTLTVAKGDLVLQELM